MNKPIDVNRPVFNSPAKLLVAFLIIGIGFYLSSIQFLGREWLTRSGCLVVMLGVWCGLGGIIQERLVTAHIRSKQRNAVVRARAKLSEDNMADDLLETELSKINDIYEAQITHAAERLRMSVGLEEVALVLLGTFIWGFGDLMCCL